MENHGKNSLQQFSSFLEYKRSSSNYSSAEVHFITFSSASPAKGSQTQLWGEMAEDLVITYSNKVCCLTPALLPSRYAVCISQSLEREAPPTDQNRPRTMQLEALNTVEQLGSADVITQLSLGAMCVYVCV